MIYDLKGAAGAERTLSLGQLAGNGRTYMDAHSVKADTLDQAQSLLQLHAGLNSQSGSHPAISESRVGAGLTATHTSAIAIEAAKGSWKLIHAAGKELEKGVFRAVGLS